MTNEEVNLLKEAILSSMEAYVDARFARLPFVKTEIGVIEGKGTDKGNKVRIKKVVGSDGNVISEGALYDNVLSVGNIIFPDNSIVYIFVPNAQYNNMFIMGQLDDTPANIKGGTINIGNNAFQVDENGNVSISKGTINIGNGKFKVDSNGNTDIHGDIKVDGSLKFLWTDDGSGELPTGYYDTMYLSYASHAPYLTLTKRVGFENSCDFFNGITVDKNASFNGNVYNSTGGIAFVSDKNAKHDIESLDLKESADFIYSQKPVSYKFNEGTSNRNHHGFIAQDVKESMGDKDWGLYIDQSINDKDKKGQVGSIGLRYDEYIADIVATCQYQKQQIEELQKELKELKG